MAHATQRPVASESTQSEEGLEMTSAAWTERLMELLFNKSSDRLRNPNTDTDTDTDTDIDNDIGNVVRMLDDDEHDFGDFSDSDIGRVVRMLDSLDYFEDIDKIFDLWFVKEACLLVDDFNDCDIKVSKIRADRGTMDMDGWYKNWIEGDQLPHAMEGVDIVTGKTLGFLATHIKKEEGFIDEHETRQMFDRLSELTTALDASNLELRKDSRLCQEYIEDETYNGPKMVWDSQTEDEIEKYSSPLHNVVAMMSEMQFLYERTAYASLVAPEIPDTDEASEIRKRAAIHLFLEKEEEDKQSAPRIPPRLAHVPIDVLKDAVSKVVDREQYMRERRDHYYDRFDSDFDSDSDSDC